MSLIEYKDMIPGKFYVSREHRLTAFKYLLIIPCGEPFLLIKKISEYINEYDTMHQRIVVLAKKQMGIVNIIGGDFFEEIQ